MVTAVLHPLPVFGAVLKGGVEAFIRDFLAYSSEEYVLICPLGELQLGEEGAIRDGVSQVELRSQSLVSLTRQLAASRLFGKLRKLAPDISTVHVHKLAMVPIAKIIFPFSKIVMFVHNNFYAGFARLGPIERRLKSSIVWLMEQTSVWLTDSVVVFSDAQGMERFRRRVLVKPWFDDQTFQPAVGESERSGLLWVGRLEGTKDPLLAIEAFNNVCTDFPENLTMVGNGNLAETVLRRIEALGLSNRVRRLEAVPATEIAELMKASRVQVISSWSETGPRVALEAMAMGCTVVSTPGADPHGLVRRFGMVAEGHSALALANAIRQASPLSPAVPQQIVGSYSARRLVPRLERQLDSQKLGNRGCF